MRVPRRRGPPPRSKPVPVGLRGMRAHLEDYLEWLRARQYSQATVRIRESSVRRFLVWCDERSLVEPTEVTQPIIERFQRTLYYHRKVNGHPLTAAFQNQILRSVRLFFRWLTRQHLTLFNPAAEIELARIGRSLTRESMTMTEVEAVVSQPDLRTLVGVRDRAMLETLYATGVRRMELAGLELHDVDQARGTLMVRQGKGRKDRLIPIGQRAREWIERYVREVRPEFLVDPDERHLFLTVDGQWFRHLYYLTKMAKRYVGQAGVTKKGGCHLFRHTVATLMLENGADIRFIQEILGHEDLSTTQVYTHVSIGKLQQIYQATHPAEQADDRAPRSTDLRSEQTLEAVLKRDAEDDEEENESPSPR